MGQLTILHDVLIFSFHLLAGSLCPWGVAPKMMRPPSSFAHGGRCTSILWDSHVLNGVISTCALNNLCSDTVGCWLPGLLSPCGSCSYVGFLFILWFFSPPHTDAKNHGFARHMWSKSLSLPPPWEWFRTVPCCRHHPYYVYGHSTQHRLRKSWLT